MPPKGKGSKGATPRAFRFTNRGELKVLNQKAWKSTWGNTYTSTDFAGHLTLTDCTCSDTGCLTSKEIDP